MASKHTRALLLLVAAVTAVVACGHGSGAPKISTISPVSKRNSVSFPLTISGRNFYRKIVPDASNANNSTTADVSVTFANGSESFTLVADSSATLTQITVPFPAGKTPGVWSVTVHADGGDATFDPGITLTVATVKISSGVEALPGTADVISFTLTAVDDNGSPLPVGTDIPFTVQLPGASASAAAAPSSFTLLAGQTTQSFDVTDVKPESFAVSVSPSVATTVSDGTATFLVGPPRRIQVVSTSTTLSNLFVGVVLEDVDRNILATHSQAYTVTLAGVSGACPSNNFTGGNATIAVDSSSGSSQYDCGAAGVGPERIRALATTPGSFLASDGVITFN
jgi:hypothetical protein